MKDGFLLKNPSTVFEDGKWYQFSHWSLRSGTTEARQSGKAYATLFVSQGTVGDLSFVANWVETDAGELRVSKIVSGEQINTDRAFTFTVTLDALP